MPLDVDSTQHKFSVDIKYASGIDFHPTQPWLLAGSTFGKVTIYNVESGKIIHSFSLSPSSISCVEFIARKNWYIVSLQDGWLRVFNSTTHKEIFAFKAYIYQISCLAVHPTKPIVFTSSRDSTSIIINAWDWDQQWHNIQSYNVNIDANWIYSIAFNPKDTDTFAIAYGDGTVKMWSIASPTPHFTINAHSQPVSCVDFYPGADKPYLVTASRDNTIKIWDYLSQTCVQTILAHTKHAFFAAFHPTLPVIITGGWDGILKIWNNKTFRIEHTLNYQLGFAGCITFREGTGEVAVGFHDGVVIFKLAHRGLTVLGDDVSAEASKEHVSKSGDGRDDVDPYQHCSTLVLDLMAVKVTNKLISELSGDNAQYVADLLSKIASDKETITQRDRKHSLHLLSKLAKSAAVFPRSLVLEGAQCNLANPVAWGGYGVIYKGLLEGTAICVKAVQADLEGVDEKKLKAHASELTIWANLEHLNVLPFLGIYASKEEVPRVCIVSPWKNNGDLLQYLKKVPEIPRKPLIHDIISGLLYLHDLDIIHADLKAKNVLVSETGRAMLADFGISRLSMTQTTMMTNVGVGTVYWMAPELLLERKSSSRESDIWAFACTCYEIITGMMPFNEYYNIALLIGGFVMKKFTPKKPIPGIGWDEDIWSIATRCWQGGPASRPSAQEILDMINSFNYMDDRSQDVNLPQGRNSVEIDYDRVLNILGEIRQSATV